MPRKRPKSLTRKLASLHTWTSSGWKRQEDTIGKSPCRCIVQHYFDTFVPVTWLSKHDDCTSFNVRSHSRAVDRKTCKRLYLKMKIRLIAAMSRNHVIGKRGRLPWSIPEVRSLLISWLLPLLCLVGLVMCLTRTLPTFWNPWKATFASPAGSAMLSLAAPFPAQARCSSMQQSKHVINLDQSPDLGPCLILCCEFPAPDILTRCTCVHCWEASLIHQVVTVHALRSIRKLNTLLAWEWNGMEWTPASAVQAVFMPWSGLHIVLSTQGITYPDAVVRPSLDAAMQALPRVGV